jgi:hypothetical protein
MVTRAILPVPPPPPDKEAMSAEQWETAAPTNAAGPKVDDGNEVTMYRTGPGDYGWADQWLNNDIADIPHDGVENGRGLFVGIPGPPPEGHAGYDIPDDDRIEDRSTWNRPLYWSDWYGSGSGAQMMRGEHVVIARIPPGSVQGYMPSDPGMVQANNDRALPQPWDASIVLGVPQV